MTSHFKLSMSFLSSLASVVEFLNQMKRNHRYYYHLGSTVKRERFFAQVYCSNETVSQTTVSTGPMKMFRLDWTNENVSFGARNHECLSRKCSTFCSRVVQV